MATAFEVPEGNQKSEIRNQREKKPETGNQKPETRNQPTGQLVSF
jgi:hypothetical protein